MVTLRSLSLFWSENSNNFHYIGIWLKLNQAIWLKLFHPHLKRVHMASILIELVSEPWTYMGQSKTTRLHPSKFLEQFRRYIEQTKPSLNVDNAIIHEEYLVRLHHYYYRNDPIKYFVATVLSSWGVNQYLLATKMSLALVES